MYLSAKNKLESNPLFLKIMLLAIALPYMPVQLGWIVAEVGRQPWIVYGMLKTSEAVSRSISVSQVIVSLIAFTLLYRFLGIVDIYLLAKYRQAGSGESPSRQFLKPGSRRCDMEMLQILQIIWFILWGVLWAVYFMLDGFVLGTGMIHNFLARNENEKQAMVIAIGPGMERQRGLAHHGRRRDLRRLPHNLCPDVQLPLHRPAPPAVRPDHPRRVPGIPGKDGHGRSWKKLWDAGIFLGSLLPALLFGVAFGNIFMGLPMDAARLSRDPLHPAESLRAPHRGPLRAARGARGALYSVKTRGDLSARAVAWPARWYVLLAVAVLFLHLQLLPRGSTRTI